MFASQAVGKSSQALVESAGDALDEAANEATEEAEAAADEPAAEGDGSTCEQVYSRSANSTASSSRACAAQDPPPLAC